MIFRNRRLPVVVGCWLWVILSGCDAGSSNKVLLSSSSMGPRDLKIQSIPTDAKADNLVAIISSPGTLSSVIDTSTAGDDDASLALDDANGYLYARGPTLNTVPNSPELISVATCSMVASAIVLDGISEGDVEDGGLPNSRHAVTLTMLFRARMLHQLSQPQEDLGALSKQGLILCVPLGADHDDQNLEQDIRAQVKLLFAAVAAENKDSSSMGFEDLYDLEIQWVTLNESEEVIQKATEKAKSLQQGSGKSLASALLYAQANIQESSMASLVVNPPHIATAFITVMNSYTKQSRATRAKIASWKSRSSRGLLIDNFGSQATQLMERTLDNFDRETLLAVGLSSSEPGANSANVASSRKAMRTQLKEYLETALPKLFEEQVSNLQSMTLTKFRNQLLRNTVSTSSKYDDQQQMLDSSAAIMRAATLLFDTGMEQLQIPALGLTLQKEARNFQNILNNELANFPESPMAKLKIASSVKKVVEKQRKPGERAVAFGLDLVAMLRPDGFGSLQGFCGYTLGGNSFTFGIHNDADDPQVIAQSGGVRPPLLRVQPKLRVDMEL